MVDMSGYKQPVHRSLLQRDMLGGVPQVGLLLLIVLGVVFIYGFELYITIVPIVLSYFIMRHFTKRDQWLIDIMIDNISHKDVYLP